MTFTTKVKALEVLNELNNICSNEINLIADLQFPFEDEINHSPFHRIIEHLEMIQHLIECQKKYINEERINKK